MTPKTQQEPSHATWATWAFVVALVAETIHQVLNMVMSFINRDFAEATLADTLKDTNTEASEQLISVAYTGSVLLMGGIALGILVLLGWLVRQHHLGTKRAATARRILQYFAIYFGLRAFLLLAAQPEFSDIPIAMFVADGIVQIIVATAAILGMTYSLRPEKSGDKGK